MSHRVAALLVALASASCAVGTPPGFSAGDSWSVPLVGALEGGPLIVPVTIHDRGPYLFMIDPDSPMSQVDQAVATELDLITSDGPRFVGERDESQPTRLAEVLRIKIGTLTVTSRSFMLMRVGAFDRGGRAIRGVLGRDILADSLVFGFDRERGLAHVTTPKAFHPPANAIVVSYSTNVADESASELAAVHRRLATATINGHDVTMHLDLGDDVSQLDRARWGVVGLTEVPLAHELVDETATARKVDRGGVATQVDLGTIRRDDVLFVPYRDRRWRDGAIAGTLGLDFFDGHSVWANWHAGTLHLVPRDGADHVAERLGRWGAMPGCAAPACTTATLALPQVDVAALPPPAADEVVRVPAQRPTLRVERTADVADRAFEVLLEARTATGQPSPLPRLLAIFPAGSREISQPLDARYIGTTVAVIDVSPFVRACPQAGACLYALPPR